MVFNDEKLGDNGQIMKIFSNIKIDREFKVIPSVIKSDYSY